ncbi:MAG: hypothetical protein HXX19_16100 [Rhodoferax sp.]|nr:hypothetical protein [Rhodoferax sp.]
MTLATIHSFLVHPSKHVEDQPKIGGAKIKKEGKLFEMLNDIYARAERECHFEICFTHTEGQQTNLCRSLIVDYLRTPGIENGRRIAERLQAVTTHKSGLGLLFVMAGMEGGRHKIVVSRFPADEGIVATENQNRLDVEFIEQVFMRSAKAYKAVVYSGASIDAEFWTGGAVDKQINDAVTGLSGYWVKEFLLSDFKTTGAAGTLRVAAALREAINHSKDMHVKEQLIAASRLVVNQGGRLVSASQIAEGLHLSQAAKAEFRGQFKTNDLFTDKFQFDANEFSKHVSYQTVELDNGGMLVAKSDQFETVFRKEPVEREQDKVKFSTQGKIINQKFRSKA